MVQETGVQSQVESYHRLKKWYLIPPYLTPSNIRYGSRVKWSNLGKGVALSLTPRCRSYWKRSLRIALNDSRQLYFFYFGIIAYHCFILVFILFLAQSVGVCNTLTASLQSGKMPPTHKCPGYDTKQSDGEAPVMLELWGMQSTHSLPSLCCGGQINIPVPANFWNISDWQRTRQEWQNKGVLRKAKLYCGES